MIRNPKIPCPHLRGHHRNNPFTRAMTPPPELSSSPSTRHRAKGSTKAFTVAKGVHTATPGERVLESFAVTS